MNLLNFLKKKKRKGRKYKKHVRTVTAGKDKTKLQTATGGAKMPRGKEMILSPGKGAAPLFIADAKGEVVEGELLDADGQYLLQKLGKETSISSYVYVIPAAKGRPAMVDLTIDGVWAFVRICAKKKIVSLKITEARVEDVVSKTKRGEVLSIVRAIVKCEDENGFTHFAVKEEPRYRERSIYKDKKYVSKELKYDPHSATMVLEKAQKKAIISHPSFPRIEAREFVKRQLIENKGALNKLGIDPATLLPSGGIKAGRGKFSDVFDKGKAAGLTAGETREKIAAGGQRLSESKTVGDVAGALKAIDGEVVNTKTGEIKNQPVGTTPPSPGPTEKPGAAPKPAKRFLANIKFPDNIPDELLEHLDYIITFGKFKNQSIKQILETNADYLRWFSDDCQGKITKGEELSGFGKAVLVHLNPVFKFLKDSGLVKTDNSTE